MDLRIVALDIAPQDTITKDNVSVRVNAVVYFRVVRSRPRRWWRSRTTTSRRASSLRPPSGPSSASRSWTSCSPSASVSTRSCDAIIDQGTDPWGINVDGRGDQGHRPAAGDEAGDGQTGRGRARAPRQGHQRGGRIPSFREAGRRCGDHPAVPRSPCNSGSFRPSWRWLPRTTRRRYSRCRSSCSGHSSSQASPPRRKPRRELALSKRPLKPMIEGTAGHRTRTALRDRRRGKEDARPGPGQRAGVRLSPMRSPCRYG